MKVLNVVGARPNFMKIAPLMTEYGRRGNIDSILIHTGQHCDDKKSDLFFNELEIPKPDVNLEVGSGTHAVQTAEIMQRFEPVHPRTRKTLATSSLGGRIDGMSNLRATEPLGYLDFLKLMSHARIVLTDSGGMQEETTILKVPCLTLRENTERPITAQLGSNRIVGTDPARIIEAYRHAVNGGWREPETPPLWDGRAAQRIVDILLERVIGQVQSSDGMAES